MVNRGRRSLGERFLGGSRRFRVAGLVGFIVGAVVFSSAGADDVNAKFFNLSSSGTLQPVCDFVWSKDWSELVSTRSSDGKKMLIFYNREEGQGKSFTYSTSGTITELGFWNNWQKTWDQVIDVSHDDGSTFNVAFYRRTDGLLKVFDFPAAGGFKLKFEQVIPNPGGAPSKFQSADAPNGWDIVVPGRFAGGRGLLFYSRMGGTGVFYEYSATAGKFVKTFPYFGWRRTWDEIAAGDFDGDGMDDLVLYDQDDGTIKLVTFDASWHIKSEVEWQTGMAVGAKLVVGKFGGSSGIDDFVLYRNDHGNALENGNGIIWKDSSAGYRVLKEHKDWSDRWTHLVPVDLGGSRTGLLFYSNQHVIKVSVYQMHSAAMSVRPTTGTNKDLSKQGPLHFDEPAAGTATWTTEDLKRLKTAEDTARKSFAPAGLRFVMTPVSSYGISSELAKWWCGKGNRAVADDWVSKHVDKDVLPITLATESTSGTGCSNRDVEFVRGSYPVPSKAKYFPHELGHYFGLPHTHKELDQLSNRAETEAFLSTFTHPALSDLDPDDTAQGTDFINVYDTPPAFDHSFDWPSVGLVDECSVNASIVFDTPNGSVTMWSSPHNLMAYNNCDELYRLTRDQVRAVRQTLYHERAGLIGK